jgi:hypothetical protein
VKDSYFGSANSAGYQAGYSVYAWVNTATGKPTAVTYNLSDSTGDHPVAGLGRRKDLDSNLVAAIRAAAQQAIDKAKEAMAYAKARSRDTTEKDLEFAFLVTEGRGGHSIYMDEASDSTSTLQGYGLSAERLAEIHRLHIPFVDTGTIPDELAHHMISMPMWPGKPEKFDRAPWGSMSYAPIEVAAWMYQALGATVYHITPRKPLPEELRNLSPKEAKAMRGWLTNDEGMVAEAMLMS